MPEGLLEAVLLLGLIVLIWVLGRRKPPHVKLGEHLVRLEYCTPQQRDAALARQAELATHGEFRWLGEIMVDMGFVKPYQVAEALRAQKRQAEVNL